MTVRDTNLAKDFFDAKNAFTTGPAELNHMLEEHEDIDIIDVRAHEDFEKGHIPGARNLPPEQWDTYAGLEQEKVNVVYCYSQTCHLASQAAGKFAESGYPVVEMEGGFNAWKDYGLNTEK